MSRKLKVLFTNSVPLIKYGIKLGFEDLGHDTMIMDGEYRLWDKNKENQLKLFKQVINWYKPDIVFSETFPEFSEEIFLYTKKKGIFHAYWSIEDTPHDHWLGDHWSNYADHIFTTTAECLKNYWNKGKYADLLLFACSPQFHKTVEHNVEYESDISLVGNNYPRRSFQVTDFLYPLLENNYQVKVYGNEWWMSSDYESNLINFAHSYKGYLPYETMPTVYSSSKIAFGLNLDGHSVTQTSMRMTEILGCGGALMLSPYTKAQEYLFHDLVYLPKNKDECLLMANEILSMTDKQRKQKASKAQEFVYKYHNYTLRAHQVIDAYLGVKT